MADADTNVGSFYSAMKYRLLLLLLGNLFLVQCENNVGIDWEITSSERSLIVNTTELPNEPIAGTSTNFRKVVFYKSLEDRQNKSNEFTYRYTSSSHGNEPRSVELDNVTYDSVYIRVESYSSWYYASYFYDDVVLMPLHNGITTIVLGEINLVRE